jgi:hypothetical protein
MARMQAMLMALSESAGASELPRMFGNELPRMIGQAAAQSKSAWLPLLLLPIALWLRERGKEGERASADLLRPLDLNKRSEQLSRQGTDLLEAYRRRMVDEIDPNRRSGASWLPWLFGGAAAGGMYWAYRQGWLGAVMPASVMSNTASWTMVRDVMTRGVETTPPDATIAEVGAGCATWTSARCR